MPDETCIAERGDGTRCPNKALAFSNFCVEHKPGIVSREKSAGGGRFGGNDRRLYDEVLYDRIRKDE